MSQCWHGTCKHGRTNKVAHCGSYDSIRRKNFNMCELGPRGTGKSYVYDEISPYSILISGGQTTVANLFYNMGSRTVGLVGMWIWWHLMRLQA